VFSAHGPYAAWASWLEAFSRGEDLPDRHLAPVDEQLGVEMRGRLLVRLEAAFRARAQLWADVLRRQLDAGALRGLSEVATTLVAARNRLQPLRRLAADPRLPEEVRSALTDALRTMVNEAQESLEQSARRQPRGAEQLLALMRENNLPAALTVPTSAGVALPPSAPASPPGRRVIF
jgi:hypothetical protein